MSYDIDFPDVNLSSDASINREVARVSRLKLDKVVADLEQARSIAVRFEQDLAECEARIEDAVTAINSGAASLGDVVRILGGVMNLAARPCEECGEEFTPTEPGYAFCSHECETTCRKYIDRHRFYREAS